MRALAHSTPARSGRETERRGCLLRCGAYCTHRAANTHSFLTKVSTQTCEYYSEYPGFYLSCGEEFFSVGSVIASRWERAEEWRQLLVEKLEIKRKHVLCCLSDRTPCILLFILLHNSILILKSPPTPPVLGENLFHMWILSFYEW